MKLDDAELEPTELHPHGTVRVQVVDDHLLVMTVDRVAKKNAVTPKIMNELGDALTRLDDDADLFAGVLTFAGADTTAGLEMPLFFTPEARAEAERRRRDRDREPVDPFGLRRRLTKPLVTAIQGLTLTVGIEVALAGDIVVAASDARLCQLEPRRGLAPLGGATVRYVQRAGWGNAMYHLLRADEFSADEAHRIGLVQEVVEPGRQIERAVELGRDILACAPIGLQHTIANARLALDHDEPTAIAAIPAMSEAVLATDDFQEGLASFRERRAARFVGR
ncbi:MAG: crotonase/enoyl-CoA hydratase family protein [Acidimicrobiales bacterium]